jgi:hypothetical protein
MQVPIWSDHLHCFVETVPGTSSSREGTNLPDCGSTHLRTNDSLTLNAGKDWREVRGKTEGVECAEFDVCVFVGGEENGDEKYLLFLGLPQ